ncbi:MAG: hypothetical protein KAR06_05800 [Deltaproteobacteria bacterium]|nr:hypothetical protein [Deltaproteobacteria bacterium]
MSDEKDIGMWATFFTSLIAATGLNFKWTQNLQKRLNKCATTYVPKDDFNHRIDRLEDNMKADFNRIYDLVERREKPRD